MGDGSRAPSGGPVGRALRSTVGRESTTFGFSILVTVTFGLLQAEEGSPDTIRIVLYAVGASLSFTVLEAVLSRGFRTAMPQHRTRVLALGTSMNVLSVLGGLGAAWLLARATSHVTVWLVAPFVAGIVYLVLESLETAWGERVARARGDDDATEVEG
ncbi:hypothetical protein Cma02nite_02970 [Cellulomonas marina]|uniref:Uncharacterized protein n=1 Tax=Cellulomonas marina TaxID=988821 RepID=A0A1I0WJA6_9CELL|nr:hypothetical protein Cma02nite_02970 [Cellulomonas marina]SFA88839.1 hypothetical protein SAMN05421867_10344 [Cellulomonas marina]